MNNDAKVRKHTNYSDILLLIEFVDDQGFDHADLVEAADRLDNYLKTKCKDYEISQVDYEQKPT